MFSVPMSITPREVMGTWRTETGRTSSDGRTRSNAPQYLNEVTREVHQIPKHCKHTNEVRDSKHCATDQCELCNRVSINDTSGRWFEGISERINLDEIEPSRPTVTGGMVIEHPTHINISMVGKIQLIHTHFWKVLETIK